MGKYATFSRKLGNAFKEAREEYSKILRELRSEEGRYRTAQRVDRDNPVRLLSAEASCRSAQALFKERSSQIWRDFEILCESTTKEFKAQLRADQTADPTKLDMATVELMRSGICTAQDLQSFATRFSGNPTMLRLISQKAKDKAKEETDQIQRRLLVSMANQIDMETVDLESHWDEMINTLRVISGQAHGRGEPDYTESMNSRYEQLVEPLVESF